MQRTLLSMLFALIVAGSAIAQPSIAGLANSASYDTAPLDSAGNPIGNNTIAQGSIFVIFGTGMGPTALVQSAGVPLTTTLPAGNGTSVAVTSGGKTFNAYMFYTSAGQVAALLPSNVPVGPATVTVTYNGQTSKPNTISVVATDFGIFTQNSQGNGPAIAQVYTSATTVNLMGLTTPAQAGQVLTLYGTGLGAISGDDSVAPGVVSVGSNVTVNVAGTVIPAGYAGRAPQYPGLDQINFTLPANVATGCYIPAEVTASGRPGNLFYLSIGTGGACTHPFGLPASALATLDAGGTINTGLFLLLQAVVLGQPAQGAGGLFENANANTTFQLYNRIQFSFGGYNYPIPAGSCAVLDTLIPAAGFAVPDFATLGGKELQAGNPLNLAGSNGLSAFVPRQIPDTGGYLTTFFSTLDKGTWTLTGTGGTDVGTFSAVTTLPANLVWSNAGNLGSPPRSTGVTITWTGGSVNAQSLVTILGSSVVVNPTDPSKSRGKTFYCNALASAGTFNIPSSVTSQLPSSAVDTGAGEQYFGQLGIFAGGGTTFTAPLVNGAKFDGGFLSYGEAQTNTAKWQ